MTTANKDGYLAKGDNLQPSSEGPDEPVVGSNQLLTATRLQDLQNASSEIARFASTAWAQGGFDNDKEGRLYSGVEIAAGTGSTFDLSIASDGLDYDGGTLVSGHVPSRAIDGGVCAAPATDFLFDSAVVDFDDIPFEDDGAKEYNVGFVCSVVPSKSFQNAETGLWEFDQETAIMGVVAIPASVSYDVGLDELTLVFTDDRLLGNASSLAGRAAMAWFDGPSGPLGDTATALGFGTVTFVGTNRLVLSGSFGQVPASVSTTAADYRIAVLGPAVWFNATAEQVDGVAHIGFGRSTGGGSWDMDLQNQFPTMHLLLQKFLSMTAPSVSSPDFVGSPKLDIAPNDNEADSTAQLTVWGDAGRTLKRFEVTKGGVITLPSDTVVGGFATLEDFIAGTSDGDVALVDTFDPSVSPAQATSNLELVAAGADVLSIDGDGQYIVVATDDAGTFAVTLRERNSPTTVVRTFTLTPPAGAVNGIARVVMNGTHVAVAYNTTAPDGILEVFNQTTGASLGDIAHGGGVLDCAIDSLRAYVVGVAGTGGFEARAVTLASPSAILWSGGQSTSDAHGATLNSCWSDGLNLYVGGNAGDPGATVHLRALFALTGANVWDVASQTVPGEQSIVSDGVDLYVAGSGGLLEVRCPSDGVLLDSVTLSNIVQDLTIDHRWLLMSDNVTDDLLVFDRNRSLSVAGPCASVSHGANISGLHTDGDKWFLVGINSTSVNFRDITRMHNVSRFWRRVVATDAFLPHRLLAIPNES